MIWADCLFSFNMSFLLRKIEDVTRISELQSLILVRREEMLFIGIQMEDQV